MLEKMSSEYLEKQEELLRKLQKCCRLSIYNHLPCSLKNNIFKNRIILMRTYKNHNYAIVQRTQLPPMTYTCLYLFSLEVLKSMLSLSKQLQNLLCFQINYKRKTQQLLHTCLYILRLTYLYDYKLDGWFEPSNTSLCRCSQPQEVWGLCDPKERN